MKYRGYFYVGFATTLNIILYALTFGHFLWLEGRVRGGIFKNWGKRFPYRPKNFERPKTEARIIELVQNSTELRFFGSAHSFNDGVVADETLVSLDKFSGMIPKGDLPADQRAFKGGTRVRDMVQFLLNEGLAFKALPSHDAQSIGGILSTDVHGTSGKKWDWGFISDAVVKLKIVDGQGAVHECTPTDDLFKAAVGGVGAVGIITEVTIQAVDHFKVEQKFEIQNLSYLEANFELLLQENEHLSFYLFPFTEKCQISRWNPTKKRKTFMGPLWEFVSISWDALSAAWLANLIAYAGWLPRLSTLAHRRKWGTDLVMESHQAFNRTIYHLHQELEFTVPFEQTFEMCRRFINLYEEMYAEQPLPYALFEVRFTPAGHHATLIGAGSERKCTWIDLVINDSHGFEDYYAKAEELIKQLGARPHLGKFCRLHRKEDLAKIHGENFARFLELARKYDPDQKFTNEFTRRIFWN